MKKITMFFLSILMLFTAATALADKVEPPGECISCGMNRIKFARSRMVVTFSDTGSTGTCSINCAVQIMQEQRGKMVKSIQVGDYNSRKLIDAKTAVWVIGGKKRGVMTPVAKWAFSDGKAATAFIRENGGKVATFAEAVAATEKELADEHQHESREQQGHEGHNH